MTLSDVVDAWTESTIVLALMREAMDAPSVDDRVSALEALTAIGHADLSDAIDPNRVKR